MKNKNVLPLFFTLFYVYGSLSMADDLNFETSTTNIIEKLSTPPVKAVKLRSSLSSINAPVAIETRGLTRIKFSSSETDFNNNTIIEEKVEVPVKQTQAHVNLKIEFDVNSYTIKSSSFMLLSKLGKALQSPALITKTFYINGHTDADGSQSYNLRLSLKRALSVKQYLMAQGDIAHQRLTVIGYGESMPLVENNSRHNKQINRRVEIVAQ